MSTGQIPWSSINAYVSANPWVDAGVFKKIIRAMDGVYMSHSSGEGQKFSREKMRRS